MKRRVVVTGIGLVTPLGSKNDGFWRDLMAGVSGIKALTQFDTRDFPVKIAGEVANFDPDEYIDPQHSRLMDRFCQFAVVAAHRAVQDAGLDFSGLRSRERIGTVVGSGVGGGATFEAQSLMMDKRGVRRVHPCFIPMMLSNMAPAHISMTFELLGPSSCVSTACASGANAIGDGMRLIQRGQADVMICGGAEAPLYRVGVAGFWVSRALSTKYSSVETASRPFDRGRNGFVLAEGSTMLVLEEYELARKRGATIYAELRGYGMSSDAYNMTMPHPEGRGAAACMRAALDDAALSPAKVDYINAHGTSTKLGDRSEAMAIRTVFGRTQSAPEVGSTKSMLGHMLGAAGATEAAVAAMAVRHGTAPPNLNLDDPDPECELNFVQAKANPGSIRVAATNSFAFGGHNACLVFADPQLDEKAAVND